MYSVATKNKTMAGGTVQTGGSEGGEDLTLAQTSEGGVVLVSVDIDTSSTELGTGSIEPADTRARDQRRDMGRITISVTRRRRRGRRQLARRTYGPYVNTTQRACGTE